MNNVTYPNLHFTSLQLYLEQCFSNFFYRVPTTQNMYMYPLVLIILTASTLWILVFWDVLLVSGSEASNLLTSETTALWKP